MYFLLSTFRMDKEIYLFDITSEKERGGKKPGEVEIFSGSKTPKLQEVSLLLSTVCSNQT